MTVQKKVFLFELYYVFEERRPNFVVPNYVIKKLLVYTTSGKPYD